MSHNARNAAPTNKNTTMTAMTAVVNFLMQIPGHKAESLQTPPASRPHHGPFVRDMLENSFYIEPIMFNCGDFTAVYSLVPLLSTMAEPRNSYIRGDNIPRITPAGS